MPRPHEMTEDGIDDAIERWHQSKGDNRELWEFLGWSEDDYANHVEQGRALVAIDYTNYRGERSTRRVRPRRLYYGQTMHHPELQYLMDAWDFDKDAERTFAMKDIHSWTVPAGPVGDRGGR